VKKLILILLLVFGMTLSFVAIGLVMLFATGTVESPEDVKDLFMGEMADGGVSMKVDSLSQIQDALIFLQQQKQEIQQDLLKLKEAKTLLEVEKQTLSVEIDSLSTQGQTGQVDRAKLRAERLDQLVVLYNAMRPADAAGIMDQMSDEMILEILPRLKERQAARILNSLTNDRRKAEISAQLLAGKAGTIQAAQ